MVDVLQRGRALARQVRAAGRSRASAVRAARRAPDGWELSRRVRADKLTFLDQHALLDLWERVRELERDQVPGAVLEAGCALGGSAIVLAAAKRRERPMQVFDVFGVIPPPTERDGTDVHARYETIIGGAAVGHQGDTYYGYLPDLRDRVAASFAAYGHPVDQTHVELVEGLFEDTIHPDGPVALGHVDGDWYESVKVCLERMWPALSPGGVLVIDDYDAWSGCRTAVDEWLEAHPEAVVERRTRLHLVKPGGVKPGG